MTRRIISLPVGSIIPVMIASPTTMAFHNPKDEGKNIDRFTDTASDSFWS